MNHQIELYKAIENENEQDALVLLQHFDNLDFYFSTNTTPLLFSITCELNNLTKKIIDLGADVNLANQNYLISPIQRTYMCKNYVTDTFSYLLEKGANVNSLNHNKLSLVSLVVQNRDFKTLDYLMKNTCVNLNVDSRNKRPLLIEAIHNKDQETIDVMLHHSSLKQLNDLNKQFERYKDVIIEPFLSNTQKKLNSYLLCHNLGNNLNETHIISKKIKI